jgi:cation diffusion facilitator CzcD-associated flavoprotein CzcO
VFDDTADVLFLGVGTLNRWKWPDLEGLKEFGGTLVHTAQFTDGKWEEPVADWGDKAVGVIGNVCCRCVSFRHRAETDVLAKGSSGIQTVAALQPKVRTLINFARQKTWLAVSFSVNEMLKLLGRGPDSVDCALYENVMEPC